MNPKIYVSNAEAWRRILEAQAGPSAQTCPTCSGRGYLGREGCRDCGAFGAVSPTRAEEIRSRPVVADGPTRPELPEDTAIECPATGCAHGIVTHEEQRGEWGFAVYCSTCAVCSGSGFVSCDADAAYDGPRKGRL